MVRISSAFFASFISTLLFGCLVLSTGVLSAQSSLTQTVTSTKDVDLAATKTYRQGMAQNASAEDVYGVLGLTPKSLKRWSAGRTEKQGENFVFQYRLAFTRDVPIGSILLDGDVADLRLLKNDTNYPGDPGNADHWQAVPVTSRHGGAILAAFEPGTKTRAVLITEKRERGIAELNSIRIFAERLTNSTPLAVAYADREYVPPLTDFAPYPAASIPKGSGRWENAGKDSKGFVDAPPVTDVSPSWFMLTWDQTQTISGLWLDSNLQKFDVEYFVGPTSLNPRIGLASEWRKIKDLHVGLLSNNRNENTHLVSFAPVLTRGLRLHITQTMEGPIARIRSLQTLTEKTGSAAPVSSPLQAATPPFHIPQTLKLREGDNYTVVVNSADGRRARNLATRQSLARDTVHPSTNWNGDKASLLQSWDLKDEAGQFVSPGKYQWKALAWPDLNLKYEMTVYPNVSRYAPENAPWLTGANGSGGWMADHTPPCSVCVAGDRVYLGSYVAESGVALIECDLEGRKQWGHHSFAAWTGARFLASDGTTVFVGAPILNTSTESVWSVDIATKKVTNLLTLQPTASRNRGMQGIAARDGKLYLSIRGQESWLAGATSADDVDLAACLPLYPPKRKPRVAYEVVPDPQGDFVRLFRLFGTPPGGATQHTLTHLETQSSSTPQQHIVLAFKKPVPIGSVVLPVPMGKEANGARVLLSVLKPNAPYPPNPEDPRHWTPFQNSGSRPWEVVAAPENTVTRALRITFKKGDDTEGDPLASALGDPLAAPTVSSKKANSLDIDLDKPNASVTKSALGFGGGGGIWKGRIEGLKLLRRRFSNIAADATVRVNSGKVLEDGSWDAQRTSALTATEPAVYALEWKSPQKIQGLAIKEIDGAVTKVDVFTGGANETIDLNSDAGWENVAEYHQTRRNNQSGTENYTAKARYMDGYVDFGREVTARAVRLRVISQWTDNGKRGLETVRVDQGGQTVDATRCRIYGVAVMKYIGGEAPIESGSDERVEIYDSASGKLVQEIPIEKPSELACHPSGKLYALSGKAIVRVINPAGGSNSSPAIQHEVFVTDLEKPTDFAFDSAGSLYVYDDAPERKNIRVYDAAGKFVRTIGEAGGYRTGAWEPTRLGRVVSLDVDVRGQLWAVEGQYHPKRVTVWKTDGTFQKEFLGNTPYGGGGVLDPEDRTRLFHGPMEFELDWETGLSRIKYLNWLGTTPPGEVPVRVKGHTYLVTRPEFQEMRCGAVYHYENGTAKIVAAMGFADAFDMLKKPELLGELGNVPLTEHYFLWSDLNGDGQVQANEVKLGPAGKRGQRGLTNFNRDLGVQFGEYRFTVKEFLPNGVPVYEQTQLPGLVWRDLYQLQNGCFYRFSDDRGQRDGVWTTSGQKIWDYPHEGWGVQSLQKAKPWTPDQVVSQFGIVGHETVKGDLGEILVVHANHGAWNIWTADGLLVGPIFRDLRDSRAKPWSMAEHARGMSMRDVSAGQEHFHGYFCHASSKNDGDKYYVVAGHNHVSVLEVVGLEKFRRMSGEFEVTAEDIRKAQEWDLRREKIELYVRSPVLDAYRMRKPPEFDGKLTGFGTPVADMGKEAAFYLGYDDTNLYVACKTRNMGPLKNSGEPWERVFKNGAAFDLFLATDPAADSSRQSPEKGDIRLQLTFANNKPLAVLYRAVVPGTDGAKAFRITSPVGETVIDQVVKLDSVRMVRTGDDNQYTLEAAIPLVELGLRPVADLRLKIDWGLLVSGPDGHDVLRRVYWANRATQIVADAPSEARFQPHLWGHVLFRGYRPSADEKLAEAESQGNKTMGKEVKKDVSDILDDLKVFSPKKP